VTILKATANLFHQDEEYDFLLADKSFSDKIFDSGMRIMVHPLSVSM